VVRGLFVFVADELDHLGVDHQPYERAGVAGADVVLEESGAPVLLVVRLKVVADKLTEIELVASRGRAEGLIFNIDGLSAPSAVMNYAPHPEQHPA
jgi:hypothetical protein